MILASGSFSFFFFLQRYVSARTQKRTAIIQAYLECRALTISEKQPGAIVSTRRKVEQYPILMEEKAIPFERQHNFLGVRLHRTLTWSSHITRSKKEVLTVVSIILFISGTLRRSSDFSLNQLYNASSVGILRYNLPVLHGPPFSNEFTFPGKYAGESPTYLLELPVGTTNVDTVAEAGGILLGILPRQDTIRTRL